MSNEKKEKVKITKIISNVRYVIGFAMRINRWAVWRFWIMSCLIGVAMAVFNTIFLKGFIDILQDKRAGVAQAVWFIVIGIGMLAVTQIVNAIVENKSQVELVKMTGKIQEEFIHKAADIDLVCYDKKEYFDDFVLAASQSEEMITRGIMSVGFILQSAVSVLAMSSLILTINPVIAIFPLAGFFVNIFTRFYIEKCEYEYENEKRRIMRKADYSKRVFYQPEYMKEVRLFQVEDVLEAQFDDAIDEVTQLAKRYGLKISVCSFVNWAIVFTFLSYWCVPSYLGYLAIVKRSIALGDAAALNNAATRVRSSLDGLNYALVEFQKIGLYAEKFRRFVDYQIEIEDAKGKETIPEEVGTLKFHNVSFHYPGSEKAGLKNINLTIKPGERIAIVGENGAGKTTFIKLLMRLYDVTEGSITYAGKDIREYTTKEYRDIFGAVFQDYQLYGMTLAENVKMDQYDEKDEKDILHALELADFKERFNRLEHGLQSEMTKEFSDNGIWLSGGESQKVAVARLFARGEKTKIAILDEPSSALDPYAEYILNKNMLERSGNSSVIFISHRLSTTREADKIYFFSQGEIVEEGSHAELMKRNGKYAEMFRHQAYYYQSKLTNYE